MLDQEVTAGKIKSNQPDPSKSDSSSPPELKMIPLDQVSFVQIRDSISDERIEEYRRPLLGGAIFPPVRAFYDGNKFYVGDGYHRGKAHLANGSKEIHAEVTQGSERDASLYAVGANFNHGIPRTAEDKRKAVRTLLHDPEWSQWNNSEIARRCKVSDDLVASVLEEASFADRKTQASKKAVRNGKEIKQQTGKIGKGRKAKPSAKSNDAEQTVSSPEPTPDGQAIPNTKEVFIESKTETSTENQAMQKIDPLERMAVELNDQIDKLLGARNLKPVSLRTLAALGDLQHTLDIFLKKIESENSADVASGGSL